MQFIKFVFIMTVIVLLNLVIVQANGEYQIPQITTISDDATKDNPLAIERYTDIAPALGYKKGEIIVGGVNLYKGDFGKTYIEFTDDYYNSFYITEEKDGKKLRTTNLPGIEKSKPGQGIRFGDDGELEKVDVSKKNSGNLAVNGVEFTAPSNSDIKFLKFYQDENSILVSLDGSKFAEPDDHENNFENPHYVSEPTNTKVRYSTEFSEKLSKVAISPGIYFEKGEIMFDPKKITSERAAASEIYSDKKQFTVPGASSVQMNGISLPASLNIEGKLSIFNNYPVFINHDPNEITRGAVFNYDPWKGHEFTLKESYDHYKDFFDSIRYYVSEQQIADSRATGEFIHLKNRIMKVSDFEQFKRLYNLQSRVAFIKPGSPFFNQGEIDENSNVAIRPIDGRVTVNRGTITLQGDLIPMDFYKHHPVLSNNNMGLTPDWLGYSKMSDNLKGISAKWRFLGHDGTSYLSRFTDNWEEVHIGVNSYLQSNIDGSFKIIDENTGKPVVSYDQKGNERAEYIMFLRSLGLPMLERPSGE